jgi:hypothetical protein
MIYTVPIGQTKFVDATRDVMQPIACFSYRNGLVRQPLRFCGF